jgi:DNA-binding NarL/FixJ family response regulator
MGSIAHTIQKLPSQAGSAVKIVVVDDYEPIRRALRQSLELIAGFVVVGEAGTGAEALKQIERVAPDVVIVDTRLPVMDGAEATRRIKERFPEVHVVAFTSTGEPGAVAPMLAAGASGYLLKGASLEKIAAVLESLDG